MQNEECKLKNAKQEKKHFRMNKCNLTFAICNFHFLLSVQNSVEFWTDTVLV